VPLIVPANSETLFPLIVTPTQPLSANNSVTDTIEPSTPEPSLTETDAVAEPDQSNTVHLTGDPTLPADKVTILTDTLSTEQAGVGDGVVAPSPPATLPGTGRAPSPKAWLFLMTFILFLLGSGFAAAGSKRTRID
jgi:hypothetical protein